MTITVLGACCAKSKQTFENAKAAAKELGLDATVDNVGDVAEIAKYGVMSTPALVVDGKVVSVGRFLSVADASALIQKALGK